MIDELPVIAVAAALAEGRTIIRDAKELRVKETDRIASVANNLRLMGVEVQEFFDGMEIHGGSKLKAARLASFGDHRVAMAFAIAGLFADGETIIEDTDCVNTSYPGILRTIQESHLAPPGHLHPGDFFAQSGSRVRPRHQVRKVLTRYLFCDEPISSHCDRWTGRLWKKAASRGALPRRSASISSIPGRCIVPSPGTCSKTASHPADTNAVVDLLHRTKFSCGVRDGARRRSPSRGANSIPNSTAMQ